MASDVSQLEHGAITLPDFILKVGGEFASSPLTKMLAPFLLPMLQYELTTVTKSPTAAALIVSDITTVMNGGTPNVQAQIATGAMAYLTASLTGSSQGVAVNAALTAAEAPAGEG